MPIKRAQSKKKRKNRFPNFDFVFAEKKKSDKRKDDNRKLSREIDNELIKVNSKKLPHHSNPNYWIRAINFLSKDIVSKVVNNKSGNWRDDFLEACVKQHEGNNYIKRR